MNQFEKRWNPRAEIRLEGDEKSPILVGNAIVYNSLSEPLGCFREIIAPGAFTESLKTADVRCLIDHNPSLLLGRNVSGTLRLSDGPKALRIECDLDDTSYALDLVKTVRRKDRDGMSFGFVALEDHWDETEDGVIRTVTKASIFDVSAVTYPAYIDTTLALRSLNEWRSSRLGQATPPPPASKPGDESRRLLKALELRSLRP